MMNVNILKITTVLILLFISTEQSISQALDSIVNEGLINNPYIKSLEYKIKSSEYRARSVSFLPPPVVGFELSDIPFNSLNLWNAPLNQNLSISQMFPLGGKLDAMSNVEKSNITLNQDYLEQYKINLRAQIKMTYYGIWLIDKKIDIQNESIELLNQLLKSITVLYEVNKITQSDIFTVQSEIAFNETQLLILKNQRDAEVFKINKLLGRDLQSKEIVISKDISVDKFAYSESELETKLVENNPSLKRMNTMIAMNKLDIVANSKEKIPDLMLQAMIMRMPRGMIVTTKTPTNMIAGNGSAELGYGLMASITLPFVPWSVGKIETKEQELGSNISSIENEKSDMLRDMISQLKTAFVKMKTSFDLTNLYSANVIPLYEKARNSQISSYQNNRSNINAVIDANRMILMQSMNYFMAQADYRMAIAEIELMVGIKIN